MTKRAEPVTVQAGRSPRGSAPTICRGAIVNLNPLSRSIVLGVCAAGLVGSLLTAPATAERVAQADLVGAALGRFPAFAALPDSRALAAPVLLHGSLRDLADAPMAGAQVLVAAWPSNTTIGALPPGGAFDVVPLARTTAGRDGSYELRALLTPVLAALTGPDGLDIELNVFHGGRHFVYLSQVKLNLADGSWAGALVAGTVAPALSSSPGGALDFVLDPAQGEPLDAALPVSWPPPTGPGEPPFRKRDKPVSVGCVSYTTIGDPKPAMTTVASAIARNGASMKTLYSSGARTASSTGFSFDGGVSFSVNGARERTMTTGGDFFSRSSKPGATVAREYRSMVTHQTARRVCKGNRADEYRVHYVTTPVELTGATDSVKIQTPWACNAGNLARVPDNETVWTENHRAATYGGAFSIKPLGGVSFSGNAQSGYSDTVKIEYRFDKPGRNYWCGDTGFPASNGQRVQAFVR